MNKAREYEHRGADFWELLTIMFIFLKLTGEIDWSWWWVLSPLIVIGCGKVVEKCIVERMIDE